MDWTDALMLGGVLVGSVMGPVLLEWRTRRRRRRQAQSMVTEIVAARLYWEMCQLERPGMEPETPWAELSLKERRHYTLCVEATLYEAALQGATMGGAWRDMGDAPKDMPVLLTDGVWVKLGQWGFQGVPFDVPDGFRGGWVETNLSPSDPRWGLPDAVLKPRKWAPLPGAPRV